MTGFDKTGGGRTAGKSDPSSLLLHTSLSAQSSSVCC